MNNAIIRRIKLDKPNTKNEAIEEAINKVMSKREKDILGLRLPWTQQEVGDKFNLTKERIRAIEARVFEKIFEYFSNDLS